MGSTSMLELRQKPLMSRPSSLQTCAQTVQEAPTAAALDATQLLSLALGDFRGLHWGGVAPALGTQTSLICQIQRPVAGSAIGTLRRFFGTEGEC
jgi:hypothetical protein